MTATFTRMDNSSAEQWGVIGAATLDDQPRVADEVLALLRRCESLTLGFGVSQLVHCLQTATLAEKAGADTEMIVGSLVHDVGKVVSVFNHDAIAGELLKAYVRDDVYHAIRVHQAFQGKHYFHHFGGNPEAREQYRGEPWFDLAATFADEWDQIAFDPDAETYPLEHFADRVREVFAMPRVLRPAAAEAG
jgi:predicted HD phosphohydrolase